MDRIPVGAVSLREVDRICLCPRQNTLARNGARQQEAALHEPMEPVTSFDANCPKEKFYKNLLAGRIENTIELRKGQLFTLPPDLRVFPDGGSFRYLILFAILPRVGRREGGGCPWPGGRVAACAE
jgi:hypothetical protein